MEEKQELKDILINEEDGKAGGSKKMLLFAAAALLVFIFAIFVVYAINSGDEQEQQQAVQQNKPEIVEETVVEEVMPMEPKSVDGDAPVNFEQVPIEPDATPSEEKSEKFDEIIKEIKEKNIPAPPTKSDTPKKSEPKQTTPKKEQPKKTESAPKQSTATSDVPKAYYIQVGANVKSEPDKKFLQKIKDAGYAYRLQHINKNGNEVVRTLVGPYKSSSEAKKDIAGVQKSINPKAFVFEVK